MCWNEKRPYFFKKLFANVESLSGGNCLLYDNKGYWFFVKFLFGNI